jgi:hypothetical protein
LAQFLNLSEKSEPLKTYVMKNPTGNFLAKLIASMPIEAIRKTAAQSNISQPRRTVRKTVNQEATLTRIFMVRYRIQHL